jgi:hypothetical protein
MILLLLLSHCLVPSITHALHDGMVRVASRISATSDEIQSCQRTGERGWNGWTPQTRISSMMHRGIFNVEGNGFAVELLKIGMTRIINEHELGTLFMNTISALARRGCHELTLMYE